jgi:phosphatidylserine/phosphatidylglycerophosphate/cardiolipin synthase-like enzyme
VACGNERYPFAQITASVPKCEATEKQTDFEVRVFDPGHGERESVAIIGKRRLNVGRGLNAPNPDPVSIRRILLIGVIFLSLVASIPIFWLFRRASPRLIAAPPGVEMHYSPAENLERLDVEAIEQAGDTIDIAAYVLTDIPVINALADAGARGVKVRIFRDANERNPSEQVLEALSALRTTPNIEEREKASSVLMHLKSYCIDHTILREGAANFSPSGLKRQDNDLSFVKGPGACDIFEQNFEVIWDRAKQ